VNNQGSAKGRQHRRLSFREDVLVDGTRLCTSTDISEGGLFVSAIQFFEEGSIVEVTIPFGQERITVKAQVKYCQTGIGIGIMFIDLDDEQKAKLKRLVASIAKTA
jgi:hypothetical protein